MEPTKEQIEAAAKAAYESESKRLSNHQHFRGGWDALMEGTRGNYCNYMRVAAPLLQMPWSDPTPKECDDIRPGNVDFYRAVRSFVKSRNAALLPKPTDPRREKIIDALMHPYGHPGFPEDHSRELADRILATLDAKD